jgi:hypothetical protein
MQLSFRKDYSPSSSPPSRPFNTPWQQKVFTKLLRLRNRIVYRRRAENNVADALSRRPHPEQLQAISSLTHEWLSKLTQWYDSDPDARALLAQLLVSSSARPHFGLQRGIIMYKNRIWLGSNVAL